MLATLTKRQKEILDFIRVCIELNGYSPSLEEIRDHFNLSAVSTVHEHLENLRQKGYLHKQISQSRGISVIDLELKNQNYIQVPLIGKLQKNAEYLKEKGKTLNIFSEQLPGQGKYFAVEIGDLDLGFENLQKGDLLVFLDSKTIEAGKSQSIYLASAQKGSLHIGKVRIGSAQTSFFSYSTQKTYSRFEISARLVLLIRNYE